MLDAQTGVRNVKVPLCEVGTIGSICTNITAVLGTSVRNKLLPSVCTTRYTQYGIT